MQSLLQSVVVVPLSVPSSQASEAPWTSSPQVLEVQSLRQSEAEVPLSVPSSQLSETPWMLSPQVLAVQSVRQSEVVLLLLGSPLYFASANCMREMRAATRAARPHGVEARSSKRAPGGGRRSPAPLTALPSRPASG